MLIARVLGFIVICLTKVCRSKGQPNLGFRIGILILAAMMVSVGYARVSADGYGVPNSATTTRTSKVSASPKMSCNVALIEAAGRNLPVGRTVLPANLYAASDRLNAMCRGHIVKMDENGFMQVYVHLKEVARAATLDRLLSAVAVSEHVDETAILGQDLTYTVVVSNLGTVTTTGVTVTDVLPLSLEPASATSTGICVTDDLPDDVSLISAIPTQGICSSYPDVVCELEQLSPADSAEVSVKASIAVSMRGQLVNTVVASSTAPKTYWGTTPPRR